MSATTNGVADEDGSWARPQEAIAQLSGSRAPNARTRVSRSLSTFPIETFTVIHGGGEIDGSVARELLDAVSAWAAETDFGCTRVVEVWSPAWRRLLASCLAAAAALGAPLCVVSLPIADDLVARIESRGVAVHYHRARQSAVDVAELRAMSQGWPLRYT